MMEGIKPYQEYRESGQAWLGNVPKHWQVYPNRALFSEVKDCGHSDEEMLSITITKGIIRQQSLLSDSSKKDSSRQDKSAYKLVCPNDIAYNKMRAWQGAIGVSDFRGIVSPAYIVMRLRDENNLSRYFHYLFRTPQFAKEAERWSYGITSDMWSLRPAHFKMIYIPQPTRDEQEVIVKFLDYVNGKMDRAIRAKRKTIALLNEQKQAIIHHAVTRGLNHSVSLKPSNTPWLGDIPEHWEVVRLGHVVHLLTGFPFPSAGFSRSENASRLLRGINVSPNGVRWNNVVYWQRKTEDNLENYVLESDDVVLGMDRPIINSGVRAAIMEEKDTPSLLLQRVARLRTKNKLNPKFLLALLSGQLFSNYIAPIFTGISVPHLSPEQIKQFKVVLPPIEEQLIILNFIDTETKDLLNTISRFEREIELLQEYRTRLISDVVTGKLDVREAAKNLPAEIITEPSDDLIDGDEEEIEEAA